jgi:hypothetical protein
MMGRQRKILPPRGLFSVGNTQEEADAKLELLERMMEDEKKRPGRKSRVDHFEAAFSAAGALSPEPQSLRQLHKRFAALPRDAIAAKTVRTAGGIQLAGFNPTDVDPKDSKQDMRAAETLQHTLAWRGEYISRSNAVKIMQRARARLAKAKFP